MQADSLGAADPMARATAIAWPEKYLLVLLSLIAGMVDLTGFLTLGNVFTAHITGNLVILAAVIVRGAPVHLAQLLVIPMFMAALATTWAVARKSGKAGLSLVRLMLAAHLLLLAAIFILCIVFKPSSDPHGLVAGTATMLAVCAMACQFAMLRLGLPDLPSTTVMTGNLVSCVLAFFGTGPGERRSSLDQITFDRTLLVLAGFFAGCVVAAIAVTLCEDWAWGLPVAVGSVAMAAIRSKFPQVNELKQGTE